MILSKGESGSNLHVRRIIFVKDLLVLSKKLKQNTMKVIQKSSAYARIGSAAVSHKGLGPKMGPELVSRLSLSLYSSPSPQGILSLASTSLFFLYWLLCFL